MGFRAPGPRVQASSCLWESLVSRGFLKSEFLYHYLATCAGLALFLRINQGLLAGPEQT